MDREKRPSLQAPDRIMMMMMITTMIAPFSGGPIWRSRSYWVVCITTRIVVVVVVVCRTFGDGRSVCLETNAQTVAHAGQESAEIMPSQEKMKPWWRRKAFHGHISTVMRRPATSVIYRWGIWGPSPIDVDFGGGGGGGGGGQQLIDITSPLATSVWHRLHHPKR
jgi:hypothetical protein